MVRPLYLLDTNILSEPTKPQPNSFVLERLKQVGSLCVMSSITYHELYYGIQLVQSEVRKLQLERFLFNVIKPSFPILSYDEHAAEIHGMLRSKLKDRGMVVADIDAQIASVAIANNLILVTRNQKDFEPIATVSTLMLENWFQIT
jgi:predicted nucleic acid-binding protein